MSHVRGWRDAGPLVRSLFLEELGASGIRHFSIVEENPASSRHVDLGSPGEAPKNNRHVLPRRGGATFKGASSGQLTDSL